MPVLKNVTKPIELKLAPLAVVVSVQKRLQLLGLLDKVDGIVGEKTINAFNKFKKLEYLEEPGVLGTSTVAALIEATTIRLAPNDVAEPSIKGIPIVLPQEKIVTTDQKISKHFTWGEATKNGSRIPQSKQITENVIKIASTLDNVRSYLGNRKITITSWYRPPAINKAVGGASSSRHLLGDGVDFQVEGMTGFEVYNKLNEWYGSKGGLGKARSFTHLDGRSYKARWNYSNK